MSSLVRQKLSPLTVSVLPGHSEEALAGGQPRQPPFVLRRAVLASPWRLEPRSVSHGLPLWRHTLRSFSLHRSCTASSFPSSRAPCACVPSVDRGLPGPQSVDRPSGPGHRGRFPLAVACQLFLPAFASRKRAAHGWVASMAHSTSGLLSAVKSVASVRRFRRPSARCSLGLCQSRACSRHAVVAVPMRRSEPKFKAS